MILKFPFFVGFGMLAPMPALVLIGGVNAMTFILIGIASTLMGVGYLRSDRGGK